MRALLVASCLLIAAASFAPAASAIPLPCDPDCGPPQSPCQPMCLGLHALLPEHELLDAVLGPEPPGNPCRPTCG